MKEHLMPTATSSPIFRRMSAVIAVAALAAPLAAHDMWIEPATFFPANGDILGMRLKVGQDLMGDPIGRDSALIKQFVFEDGAGRKPVIGRDGGNPAGF